MRTGKQVDLYSRFKRLCESSRFFNVGDKILIAVSGGPDSMALLDLMIRFHNDNPDIFIEAAHYNHKLRPEADGEQKMVEDFCLSRSLRLHTAYGDVAWHAAQANHAIHAVARDLRYEFLHKTAVDMLPSGNKLILTAHHFDDQVETVLLRLFSGSGAEGLGGTYPFYKITDSVTIVRPLLEFSKAELLSYCNTNKIPYATDYSNEDDTYPRNRIRKHIVPIIKEQFGDAAFSGIARSAHLMRLTSDLISVDFAKAWDEAILYSTEWEFELDYNVFNSYLTVIRFRILQNAAVLLAGKHKRFDLQRIILADNHLQSSSKGRIELGNQVAIELFENRLFVFKFRPIDWNYEISLDRDVHIPGFGILLLQRVDHNDWRIEDYLLQRAKLSSLSSRRDSTALAVKIPLVFDTGKLNHGLLKIRPSRPGDRIVAFGMSGHRKVSDILRAMGIPRFRRNWPVVVDGNEIIAIPPFQIADSVKIDADTISVASLQWH